MSTINFSSKQCERIRRHLDAYLSSELLVETTGEVLRHLETCSDCSRELEDRMRVRHALRKAIMGKLPPEDLNARVRTRLRKTQSMHFPLLQAAPAWALAVVCLVLVVAGIATQQWLKYRSGRQMIAGILTLGVSDHLHCAIKGHNYPEIANPPDQLLRKLGPRYAELLPVVEARLPDFQVLEAHICSVPGSPRKYVHFIARGQGTILSVILTRRDDESLPANRFLVARSSGGVRLYEAKLDGMSVAGFETKDYFGFVVSNLNGREMLQLASALAPPLRNVLNNDTKTASALLLPNPLHLDASR